MFFAYLFEQCFCLLFPRTFFKCMHTFKTRDLQKTLYFLRKNAILEEPPLQTTYEKMHFLRGIVPCFLFKFRGFLKPFLASFFASIFGRIFWPKIGPNWPQNLVGRTPFFDLFRGYVFLWYFCCFWGHFWPPFGTLWGHFGTLLAHIGTL